MSVVKTGDAGEGCVVAMLWETNFPVGRLLEEYRSGERDATGTVVVHAGRIKLPGKKVPDMTFAMLEPVVEDPLRGLEGIAAEAVERFGVLRCHIHHQVGKVYPGDDVLLAVVSSVERRSAFEACGWVVDAIKEEGLIRLVEGRED